MEEGQKKFLGCGQVVMLGGRGCLLCLYLAAVFRILAVIAAAVGLGPRASGSSSVLLLQQKFLKC